MAAYGGVSEDRGDSKIKSSCSTLNSRILILRTLNKVPLIFGKSRMKPQLTEWYDVRSR